MRAPVTRVRRAGTGRLMVLAALSLSGLALAFAPAQGGAAVPAGGQIAPGRGVGPVTLGMAARDLLRVWGTPAHMEQAPDGVSLYDYGESHGAGVFVTGDRVSQILVVDRNWTTPNGIKVGATRSELIAFLGRPDDAFAGETPDELRFLYRRHGLVFILKNRNVVGITVIPGEGEEGPRGLPPDDPAVRKPFLPTPTPPRY